MINELKDYEKQAEKLNQAIRQTLTERGGLNLP
jgi:hypothetical protein